MATDVKASVETVSERTKLLEEVQDRVLWLAVHMVDYANHVRPNPGDLKVGGPPGLQLLRRHRDDLSLLRVHAGR